MWSGDVDLNVGISLGKKLTRQEDQKHFYNFVWPYGDFYQQVLCSINYTSKSYSNMAVHQFEAMNPFS